MENQEKIEVGTTFVKSHQGYTVTGWGIVDEIWEIVEVLEDGNYKCKQTRNDAVMSVNENYRRNFSGEEILKYKKDRFGGRW